jgi:ribosome maturation factor RimP
MQLAFGATADYTGKACTGRISQWARAHFFVGRRPKRKFRVESSIAPGSGGDGKREMELERIREAAERVARSTGIEVVDVEWKVGKQRFLRVYIDKPDGVSHRDCETVSNQLSVILDVEDLVPGPHYILEVSSPGLDRKLTKPAEFERFAGRLARISTSEPVENQKFFEGRLAGFADGKVQIEVKGRVLALPMEGIRKANLVVEF